MDDDMRRFDDHEVAEVLELAAELQDVEGLEGRAGLSLSELTDIGQEVGITPEAIRRAATSVAPPATRDSWSLSGRLIHKAVRTVARELDRDGVASLVDVVDERRVGSGSVTLSSGYARWVGRDHVKETLVSIKPREGETVIKVVEKLDPRLRAVVLLAPALWILVPLGPLVGSLGLSTGPSLAVAGLTLAGCLAVGRGAWSLFTGASRRRVKRLADRLTTAANDWHRSRRPDHEPV